ncbi:MAG: DUF6247 family protein [Actinomycetota bacterium]|nr:DUF6247 family protein [Actinomycetota bacterium]
MFERRLWPSSRRSRTPRRPRSEALLPEERPDFDRQYRRALEVAAESLTLDELHETLKCWRHVAWMTQSVPAHGRLPRGRGWSRT